MEERKFKTLRILYPDYLVIKKSAAVEDKKIYQIISELIKK